MSVSAAGGENPQFVVIESEHIDYDEVYGTGMVKNGSKVTIEIVLTNFSKVVNESELIFDSKLKKTVWGISIDGSPEECRSPFTIDHIEVTEARITLTGDAPEVYKRTEVEITLLNITQKIKDEEDLVICIREHVTSEIIEDVIIAINNAREDIEKVNVTIANATEAGVDASVAKTSLELANEHLGNSQYLYNAGRQEEALEEAELALKSAKEAEEKAGSAVGGRTFRNYVIIAVVVVIAVVAFVFLLQQRSRKRGVY